jgi:DNA-binding transcriptional MerR regulator
VNRGSPYGISIPASKWEKTGHGMNKETLGQYSIHSDGGAAAESGKSYTIGDLAREFGVTLRTLRFYEDRGLLSPRRDGTARIYDARDRDRLSVILKGKQLGFTLTEIRAMLAEERLSDGSAAKLQLSMDQIEDQINHLEQQKAEIEEALAELRARRAGMAAAA